MHTMLKVRCSNSRLYSLVFHSNTYGIAEWQNGRGFIQCNRWEDEQQAQEQSYLSRHYTALMLNGTQDFSYALNMIVPDVCRSFPEEPGAKLANRAAYTETFEEIIDIDKLYNPENR